MNSNSAVQDPRESTFFCTTFGVHEKARKERNSLCIATHKKSHVPVRLLPRHVVSNDNCSIDRVTYNE